MTKQPSRAYLAKLSREVWPPSLLRLNMETLSKELPTHPEQIRNRIKCERKAENYWASRHAKP
jgi:hypothetical protein